ncbi:MAG: carboxypeptidase Q [Planctomycetota bacterium]|jgi:carboxypeptidase Q
MSTIFATALLALPLPVFQSEQAIAPEVEAYRSTVSAILSEALVNGQTYKKLESLIEVAPHRLSGSPGAAAAVEWARQAMLADGLENVRLEPCMVTHWERGKTERLRVVGPPELAGVELPILALGGSIATAEHGLIAEVIEVQNFEELRALGDKAKGKIVFFNRPMDATLLSTFPAYGGAVGQRVNGAVEAAKVGGVAAIVRSMTTRLDDFPHTGGMRYAEGVTKVPTAAVSTRGAELISDLLEKGETVRLHLELDCKSFPNAPSFNVVGELVGHESPEEVVVLGGHLDCWDVGQGAHDDGGPCCQTVEAVRILKKLNLRSRRTLRVVLFMNEENGLGGANAYYDAYKDQMQNHVFAIESDSGAFTPRGFRSDAGPKAMAVLRDIVTLFEGTGGERMYVGGGGADVSPMKKSGVITASYLPDSQRYFDLHHSARDTIAEVSPRELELGAGLITALVYVIADLEQPLHKLD